MPVSVLLRSCLAVGLMLFAPTALRAEQIVVFAAASLRTSLDAAAAKWHQDTGNKVVLSYAASSALARQIEAGAPADVFISASSDWLYYLDAGGFIIPGSARPLFGSRIVLIAPGAGAEDSRTLGSAYDLAAKLGSGPLAMALIDSVPAGIYGKQALQSLGLWDSVAGRIAQTENVRVALAFVAAGEAPLGIVYATDAAAEPRVRILGYFPESSHEPIIYPGAVVAEGAEPDAALAFLDWLATPTARVLFEAQGFIMAEN